MNPGNDFVRDTKSKAIGEEMLCVDIAIRAALFQ